MMADSGDLSGSREPNPQAVSALPGFDPGRYVADPGDAIGFAYHVESLVAVVRGFVSSPEQVEAIIAEAELAVAKLDRLYGPKADSSPL